jgi:hypothetical protein
MTLARFFRMVAEVAGVGVTRRRAPAWLLASLALVTRGVAVRALPDPVVLEMANHHWGLTSLWSRDELGYASRAARQTVMDTVTWLRSHHPDLAGRSVRPERRAPDDAATAGPRRRRAR